MRWISKLNENIKRGLRSGWISRNQIPTVIQVHELMDFELSAIRNRIWYWGDGNKLEEFYKQSPEEVDKYKFWASRCSSEWKCGNTYRPSSTDRPRFIIHRSCGYE